MKKAQQAFKALLRKVNEMIRKQTLRELMVERIFFAFTDEELQEMFDVHPNEVETLSDLDLLELYEETMLSGSNGCDEL